MSRYVRPFAASILLAAATHAQQAGTGIPAGGSPGSAEVAKAPSAQSVSGSEVRDLSVQPPPADSPFFTEREEAREAAAKAGREGYGMYAPKPPRPPARAQIAKFFREFLHPGASRGAKAGSSPMTVVVEPSEFSLGQTAELDVSVRITNATRNEMEFLFPDNQRIEILLKDDSGTVVSRWSEDRSFDRKLGFTEINPSEFVVFAERLPTAKMSAGRTYTVEVSLANQEGYSATATVTPTP
jgi:hypothetical protein